MKVIFMGTNGWYDTRIANTCSILIDSRDFYVVLDAGNGIHRLDRYCKEEKPLLILLSHFHLDHIGGLHILGKFRLPAGLTIAGPEGTRKFLRSFLNQPFTMPMKKLPYRVRVLELPSHLERLPFSLECMELLHSTLTLGYRLRLQDKVIAYCPDTGTCNHAVALARRADLLISECSFRTGMSYPDWPHLNPVEASRIAKRARAKQLILTHFDPTSYRTAASRSKAEAEARAVFPCTVAAKDGLVIEL